MSEEEALRDLTGASEGSARRAFDRLCQGARPRLEAYLRSVGGSAVRGREEDVVQSVFLRVWAVRTTLRFANGAAWMGFLRRAAYRAFLDTLRAGSRLPTTEEYDMNRVAGGERPLTDSLLAAIEAGTLDDLADAALLRLPPEGIGRENRRRLLAGQLYYLDGEPLPRIPRLLGPPAPTRAELDRWLTDPAVLRHVACSALYYPPHRLAASLLGQDAGREGPAEGLAEMAKAVADRAASDPDGQAGAPSRWTWAEALVIVWRYGFGLTGEQITARADCPLPVEKVTALLERCASALPFEGSMAEFLERAAATEAGAILGGRAGVAGTLAETPVWHRLAFAYAYRDDLPHKDVRERIAPPASLVGREITAGALNMWLSGGRLLNALAKFVRENGLTDDPETEG